MSNKYFVFEYENNEQEMLKEINFQHFLTMILTFDREEVECPVESRLQYSIMNDIQSIKHLYNLYNVQHVIHQDSERDIFIINQK